jgi:hypothetical protein
MASPICTCRRACVHVCMCVCSVLVSSVCLCVYALNMRMPILCLPACLCPCCVCMCGFLKDQDVPLVVRILDRARQLLHDPTMTRQCRVARRPVGPLRAVRQRRPRIPDNRRRMPDKRRGLPDNPRPGRRMPDNRRRLSDNRRGMADGPRGRFIQHHRRLLLPFPLLPSLPL